MVEISTANSCATLINVFTVDPANQDKLVDMLVTATEQTMSHIPGFISASIHKSADGTRVTNYAQWRRKEDFEAMLKDPRATDHMKPIQSIATFDAHIYEVVDSFTA